MKFIKPICSVFAFLFFATQFLFGQISVLPNGNVGVKNTNPIWEIDMSGRFQIKNVNTSAAIILDKGNGSAMVFGAGNNAGISFDKNFDFEFRSNDRSDILAAQISLGLVRLSIKGSNGYVGIGTSSPLGKLHVISVNYPEGLLVESTNASASSGIRIISSNETWGLISGNSNNVNDGIFSIYNDNAGQRYFNITPAGNVGIGIENPLAKLDIKSSGNGTTPLRIKSGNNGNAILEIAQGGSGNPNLFFGKDDGTRTVQIASAGDSYFIGDNFGIGTSFPSSRLHVYQGDMKVDRTGQINNTAIIELTGGFKDRFKKPTSILFKNYDSNSAPDQSTIGEIATYKNDWHQDGYSMIFSVQNTNAVGLIEAMRLNRDGNVGIGTSSPSSKLHVEGNTRITDIPLDNTLDDFVVFDGQGNLKSRAYSSFNFFSGDYNDLINTPSIPSSLTASNGVTINNNNISLGGSFQSDRIISPGAFKVIFSGTNNTNRHYIEFHDNSTSGVSFGNGIRWFKPNSGAFSVIGDSGAGLNISSNNWITVHSEEGVDVASADGVRFRSTTSTSGYTFPINNPNVGDILKSNGSQELEWVQESSGGSLWNYSNNVLSSTNNPEKLSSNQYNWNVDQTLGYGNGSYIMMYNDASDEIEATAWGQSCKVINDADQNINTSTWTAVTAWKANAEWVDPAFTYANDVITITRRGRFRIEANLFFERTSVSGTSDERLAPQAIIRYRPSAGSSFADVGSVFSTGYIRGIEGHDQASIYVSDEFQSLAGGEYQIFVKMESIKTDEAKLIADKSYFKVTWTAPYSPF